MLDAAKRTILLTKCNDGFRRLTANVRQALKFLDSCGIDIDRVRFDLDLR